MMYVNLKREINETILGVVYHLKIGDKIRVDPIKMIGYHMETGIHFDIDESEYNCIQ